ncbi:MAG: DUF5808 domain-containing protein [Terriglobia bacterium]
MSPFLTVTLPFLLSIILVGGLLYWMPGLTRPDLYFAVTVPPTFRDTDEGHRILGSYRTRVLISSLLALGLVLAGGHRHSIALLLVSLVVQYAGCLAAYLHSRQQVKPHATAPTQVREATLAPSAASLPGGWLLQIGPFLMLAAAALYLHYRWADIPLRFPIHWGLDGKPNGWAQRTIAGVYAPLFIATPICLMLAAFAYGMKRWSRPIRLRGQAGQSEESYRRTMTGIMVATEYFLAIVFVWVSLLPFSSASGHPRGIGAVLGLELVLVIVTIAVLARKGQGGTRAVATAPAAALGEETQPVGDRTLDRYWKAGMFYVNRDDPSLFIEKRFGLGYTFNFGRPMAWVILVVTLLVPLAAIILAKLGSK